VITVASVVEGDGDVRALPVPVRRIAHEHGVYEVEVPFPFRLPRAKFLIPAEFARAVELQARRIVDRGGVVALLDADDDCAVELSATLDLGMARDCRWFRKFESDLLAILRG
jgi:hypothetical protein